LYGDVEERSIVDHLFRTAPFLQLPDISIGIFLRSPANVAVIKDHKLSDIQKEAPGPDPTG
jgi:hypothetical protein